MQLLCDRTLLKPNGTSHPAPFVSSQDIKNVCKRDQDDSWGASGWLLDLVDAESSGTNLVNLALGHPREGLVRQSTRASLFITSWTAIN